MNAGGQLPRAAAWCIAALLAAVCYDIACAVDVSLSPTHFETWIQGLVIPLSANTTFDLPFGMGKLELTSGSCRALQVGAVQSWDSSQDLLLQYKFELRGIGIECTLAGESDGFLELNLTVVDSSVNASLQMLPHISPEFPKLPTPFGGLNMTGCAMDIRLAEMSWSGSSSLVNKMNGWGKDKLIDLMGTVINAPLCDGLGKIVATRGTDTMHDAAQLVLPMLSTPEPLPKPKVLQDVVNWAEYPPLIVMNAMLRDRLPMRSHRVVEILRAATMGATLFKTSEIGLYLQTLQVEGMIDRNTQGLAIEGADEQITVFGNLSGLTLQSTLVLQVFLPTQPTLTQIIHIALCLDNFSIGLRVYAEESIVKDTKVDDIMNMPKCMIEHCLGTTDPRNASVVVDKLRLGMRPLLAVATYGGPLEIDIARLVDMVLSSFFRGYMPTAQAVANGGLGYSREAINGALWKFLDGSRKPCSREELLLGVSEEAVLAIYYGAFFVALLGVFASAVAQWRGGVRTRARETASTESSDDSHCLAMEQFIPWFVKVFYPCALLFVLLLFVYADLDLSAAVHIVMAAKGQSVLVGPMFSFSLLSMVVLSWNAGAIVISVMVALASGIWPLAKLMMLCFCWLAPPSTLSRKQRGRFLYLLDVCGKYSFLDSWLMVLSLNAFSLEWQSLGDEKALMKVQMTHLKSFYFFVAATALSLLLGHVASEAHVRTAHNRHRLNLCSEPAALSAAELLSEDGAPRDKVARPLESRGPSSAAVEGNDFEDSQASEDTVSSHHPSEKSMKDKHAAAERLSVRPLASFASRWTRVAITSALTTTLVMIIASLSVTSFYISMTGIFTEFIFGEEVRIDYSLITVGLSVPSAHEGNAGMYVLEIVYILLAVLLPVVSMIALMALLLVPMRLATQEMLIRACYIVDMWACFDVAVWVLIIGSFQFGRLSKFLIQKSDMAMPCNQIKSITKDKCMLIAMSARSEAAVVVIACFLAMVVPKVAMRISASSIFHKHYACGRSSADGVGKEVHHAVAQITDIVTLNREVGR